MSKGSVSFYDAIEMAKENRSTARSIQKLVRKLKRQGMDDTELDDIQEETETIVSGCTEFLTNAGEEGI